MLSDVDILAELDASRVVVDPPPSAARVQPVSIDLTLGCSYRTFGSRQRVVRIADIPPDLTTGHAIDGALVIQPGAFVLLTTAEHVTLPDNIVGHLDGKSTLARLGLLIHVTGGLIDPGFSGQITLEASNVGPLRLEMRPGDLIAQMTLTYTTTPCRRPYGTPGLRSHYQHQRGATGPAGAS